VYSRVSPVTSASSAIARSVASAVIAVANTGAVHPANPIPLNVTLTCATYLFGSRV
jgi:hypothetical protein